MTDPTSPPGSLDEQDTRPTDKQATAKLGGFASEARGTGKVSNPREVPGAQDAIRRMCELQYEVAKHVTGYGSAADCFCGESGFWPLESADDYRNDGAALAFIEEAVAQAIAVDMRQSSGTPDARSADSKQVARVSSGGSSVTREARLADELMDAANKVSMAGGVGAGDIKNIMREAAAALVAATGRTEEIVAERIEGWRTHVQSKLAKMGAELLEAQAGFEMYEAVAYQERERAEAAGARAAELETALAAIVEAEYGIDGNPVYRRNADTGEAIARARHVLARDGKTGLGGAGGASSTGGKTEAGGNVNVASGADVQREPS